MLRNGELLAHAATAPAERTAAALAPLTRQAAADAGVALRDVELIAVTHGPGSFTGLRVGVTMAKTLAYALRAEVLGVDTLEVIAHQAPAEAPSVWALLDAQRQQLFAARFERGEGEIWIRTCETHIVDVETFLGGLTPSALIAGPGIARIRERLPESAAILPEGHWQPQAETVGRLANAQYIAGRRDDLWKLTPLYFRPSAAEEKWAKRKE